MKAKSTLLFLAAILVPIFCHAKTAEQLVAESAALKKESNKLQDDLDAIPIKNTSLNDLWEEVKKGIIQEVIKIRDTNLTKYRNAYDEHNANNGSLDEIDFSAKRTAIHYTLVRNLISNQASIKNLLNNISLQLEEVTILYDSAILDLHNQGEAIITKKSEKPVAAASSSKKAAETATPQKTDKTPSKARKQPAGAEKK